MTVASFVAMIALPLLQNAGLEFPAGFIENMVFVFLASAGVGGTLSAVKRVRNVQEEGKKTEAAVSDARQARDQMNGLVSDKKELETSKNQLQEENKELLALNQKITDDAMKMIVGNSKAVDEGDTVQKMRNAYEKALKAGTVKDGMSDLPNVYGKTIEEIRERHKEAVGDTPQRIKYKVGGEWTVIPKEVTMQGYRWQKNTIQNKDLDREEFAYGTQYLYVKVLKAVNHVAGTLWKKDELGRWSAIQGEQATGDGNRVLRFEMWDADRTPMDRGSYGIMVKFMTGTGQGGYGVSTRRPVEETLDEFEIV